MESIETDILIAGGGIAGLSAAAGFAAAGFDVICVDPVPPVTTADNDGADLRSTALLQPSIVFLERAGLWSRLAPHAAALRVMRIADAGGAQCDIRETADFAASEVEADAFGYNLPNWLLRREMVAHLEGASHMRLRAGMRVDGVTARTSGAVARLSDGGRIRARLVVAADGRDSVVREIAGIGVRRWSYGQKALAFAVEHPVPHGDVSIEIHRTGGPFTLVPLPDAAGAHRSAVVWMETGPRAQALYDMEPPEFERALNARACGVLGELRLGSARRLWPIICQVADRLDGPRTALVSEAAHVLPPIGAQGLNMSLRDIEALLDLCVAAREAGEDIGSAELLGRYNRARYGDILIRIAGVDALNRAAMAQWRPLRDARRLGLTALHGLAPARRMAMQFGLGVR